MCEDARSLASRGGFLASCRFFPFIALRSVGVPGRPIV